MVVAHRAVPWPTIPDTPINVSPGHSQQNKANHALMTIAHEDSARTNYNITSTILIGFGLLGLGRGTVPNEKNLLVW
jgi:hypothetical protein